MKKVAEAFADFALEYRDYDRLPPAVVRETKRVLLNSVGIAVGGIASDKGKIGVQFARLQGGTPEATLLGIGGKYSTSVAAFANAELLNGLDMDGLPHIPPIVIPAVLAAAEANHASGKELIAALAVGMEVARRLSRVLLSIMTASIAKYGKTPDIFGNSNEHIIGAAVGCGLLMGMNREELLQTIGIAAYYCSLPVCRDWESTMPKSISMCPSPGWPRAACRPHRWQSLATPATPRRWTAPWAFPPSTAGSRSGIRRRCWRAWGRSGSLQPGAAGKPGDPARAG